MFVYGSLLFVLDCLGGVERLVVDVVVELFLLGYYVYIFMVYYDKKWCFEEMIDGDFFLLLSYFDVWELVVKLFNFVYVGL